MDERKILKLGKRQKPSIARGVVSGTQSYIPPSQAADVVSREAKDVSIASQRKQEKALRRKQLAYYMSKASGGSQAQFEKVIASEDWDDLDVQEMLLEDRFSKYRDTPITSTSEAVKATVAQTNKNATTRKLEQIQKQREFVGKETGAISSNYEDNASLLTPETVVAGKIKAAGLENELANVLNKYDTYLSMPSADRQKAFSKEEISIFNNISLTGLTPSKLTSKKSVLDFGGNGGSFDEQKEDNDSLTVVEFDYAQDNKTPHSGIAAIFGAYRESLTGATYDILPINRNEVDSDLLHNEFSLKAPERYPDYMQPARGMKGSTVKEQHAEALGLPQNANVQEYFDKLAEQYIDPQKLEYMTDAEKSKAIKLISMQISKMLPARLKEISVQNATSIQANDDSFNGLVEQYGVDEAVKIVGKGGGNIIPPTAAYNAYPSPHELVSSLNSSKMREFAEGVVKRGMTKKGIWTDDPEQQDTMSTLLTYGTHNLSYSKFDQQDDEYQRATVKRAALTELPKQLGKIYGISDSAVSRKSWGGGLSLNYESLEQSLDEQLDDNDSYTQKSQLDRELEHKPAQLDRYARDELARTVDVFFQPAGDLAADYKDDNLTQVGEYQLLAAAEVDLQDDDGSAVPAGEPTSAGPDDDKGNGSSRAYVDQTGVEALTREGPGGVDDSFATAAPSVDMQAVEGVREGASTNKRASHGNGLGESVSTTGATSGSRLGQSVAARAATPTPTTPQTDFNVNRKPTPATKPIEATTASLATRDERLEQARISYAQQNPEVTISSAPQGSQQWLDERKGLVTASDVGRVIRSDRARNTFVGEKAMENWGMTTTQPFQSEDIERGHRLEKKIRQEYEKQTNTEILELGLLQRKEFPGGASLDGLVTKDGEPTKRGVEFKAPREFRNFAEYHDQTQMQMAVAKLDSVDIVQGVEVDGKLRTQTQTVNKDLEWQRRNKSKIEQAQESIARNSAMSQEEFLAAQASMAADKSGKYGFLVSANKQEVEEAVGGKGKGSGGSGGGKGRKPNNRMFADPDDRNPADKKPKGGKDEEASNRKSRGWLSQAYNTVKDVTQFVDNNAQKISSGFRSEIGEALDYGVNPGQYLGNNIALRSAGVSEKDARSATLSGMQVKSEMEASIFDTARRQVIDSRGLEDFETKMELADKPMERAEHIIQNAEDRDMTPAGIQQGLRANGLYGLGGYANLPKDERLKLIKMSREQPQASLQDYASVDVAVNSTAEVVNRRAMGTVVTNAAITKDAGFAKRLADDMTNIPAIVGGATDEGLNAITGINGSQEHIDSKGGSTYSGQVQRIPVDVTVTLNGSNVSVQAKSGDSSATSNKDYSGETSSVR